ncbi:MAG: hypothetical protein V3R65_09095 [Acidiferrobacterales bacterium]
MKTSTKLDSGNEFLQGFRGPFIGIMEWKLLDEFWRNLEDHDSENWYIYAIGEAVPSAPVEPSQVAIFTRKIDALIRHEHPEDYCGIVYTDSKTDPSFIKIYDPNNLGVVCGFSNSPPLPGWVMSKIPPVELNANSVLPANRRHWWQHIWKKAS